MQQEKQEELNRLEARRMQELRIKEAELIKKQSQIFEDEMKRKESSLQEQLEKKKDSSKKINEDMMKKYGNKRNRC